MNLAHDLERAAARWGDKPAIVADGATVGFADLDRRASRVAEAMEGLGVGRGDRVGVMLGSTPEHVAVFYGVEKLGALHVGTHLQLTAAEVAHQIANARPRVMVVGAAFEQVVADAAAMAGSVEHIVVSGPPGRAESRSLAELTAGCPGTRRAEDLAPDDPSMIFYTSGTTGVPKGVVHSHDAISVLLDALSRRYSVSDADTHLIALPLFLLAILVQGPCLSVRTGGTLHLLDRYDAERVARLVTGERITFSGATIPTMFIDLARLADEVARDVDLRSLRIALCGGSPMPEHLRAAFEERYGTRIVFGFGGTEGPGGITADPVDGERRSGSVGIPMDHIDVRIVDDDDNALPAGTIGEIATGPHATGPHAGRYKPMKGYWGMPAESAEALRNGYLHWGDLGYLDDDGYLYIVDRKKDMIIRAGMNIYPAELERLILDDPRVEACAVVGVAAPDERLGEVPVAFVQLKEGAVTTEQEILDLVAGRAARYKHLDAVELVDDLPRNSLGKILKRELRARRAPG